LSLSILLDLIACGQANMPFIAFVAKQNIPARKELTFDYSPGSADKYEETGEVPEADKVVTKCEYD